MTPEWVFQARLERVRELLMDAADHYAREAKTTPHSMHVDDHRGKAKRLTETAAAVERIRLSFLPRIGTQAEDEAVFWALEPYERLGVSDVKRAKDVLSARSKLRARLDRKDDDG